MFEPELASVDKSKITMRHKYLGINLIILGFFVLDRILKAIFLAKNSLLNLGPINLSLTKNPQTAFGYLQPSALFYIIIIILISFLIYKLYQAYQSQEIWSIWAYTLVIIGGFSNLLDRIKYGFVVDYVYIGHLSFFNLADLMISAGIIVLIIYCIHSGRLAKIKNN
ncbi:MAG: signal peptidase II [Patescibacteria group bacterium]|nr:signal peptidase II [Patescibacteria group bacterium]MDD5121271.1 signal peptidase II [Patescibacteria group bacterium]MDD5221836.1 signal peptidase II [Patescibacteria group bacterium]MDD5395810.1 signal peptidase II [Patescibacteria group bacterium]